MKRDATIDVTVFLAWVVFSFLIMGVSFAETPGGDTPQTPGEGLSTGNIRLVRTTEFTAITMERAARQGKVEAGGLVWTCGDHLCTARSWKFIPLMTACASIAMEVGELRVFQSGKHPLSETQLADCNKGAAESGGGSLPRAPGTIGQAGAQNISNPEAAAGGQEKEPVEQPRTVAPSRIRK